MSLGRLTININSHKSGTTCHGSPPDQTTKGIHHPVSLTRNWPKPDMSTTHMTVWLLLCSLMVRHCAWTSEHPCSIQAYCYFFVPNYIRLYFFCNNVVSDLGWSSFYYNKVKSHYTLVNAQEDVTAHKEVLWLIIFKLYGFIKIMSDNFFFL
ncbi:hypothetical protein PHYBLDRAFT_64596 [Phycomyces blakesleeanus NRRL 1555(-)]|uniref:Uncharacterized protein n=1 Tax=Phycomyces blakesleeanus (strain ATCC 8743b / DSM 1359 / FGSC 10004 / NBRC 33097 / NRRL 1555) TaxID=763407 RepID=A0A162W975_PHYB8|nr:hypothetical protein PHYBLDRAFT_64596 [Phycomyces blakesleeanus NRRL 1555(-)]OAD65525.1 hypothetical protein PHYBLDRAFT_64596 [Phycomyces blakesleeanus NRRL 1555(-)]|eukprot:XP_018283565.1 hypothetical protein PHYBLDRAFT_64596 [Phycomyces blakesleeanus NRRL 1555(-)]